MTNRELTHEDLLAELLGMVGHTVIVAMRAGYVGPLVRIMGRLERATPHDFNIPDFPSVDEGALFFHVVPTLSVMAVAQAGAEATGFVVTRHTIGRWTSKTLWIEDPCWEGMMLHVCAAPAPDPERHLHAELVVQAIAAHLMEED